MPTYNHKVIDANKENPLFRGFVSNKLVVNLLLINQSLCIVINIKQIVILIHVKNQTK